jgi:hypothetical protein
VDDEEEGNEAMETAQQEFTFSVPGVGPPLFSRSAALEVSTEGAAGNTPPPPAAAGAAVPAASDPGAPGTAAEPTGPVDTLLETSTQRA